MAHYYESNPPEKTTDSQVDELEGLRPDVDRMFHEGHLPNLITYIPYCNYWKQSKKRKNWTFIEALIWLISKAIPWRCNVRAIRNTFTKDCFIPYPNIYEVIVSMFTCSLLGAYRHAKIAPRFGCRLAIYKYMILQPLTRDDMIGWFQREENQMILQNIIREFIVFATAQIPALRESMIERHRWNQVEERTYTGMDEFRKHIDKMFSSGSIHWFQNVRSVLSDFDTYHLRFHESKPNPRLFIEKMAEQCTSFDDEVYCNPEYRKIEFTEQEVNCLRELIKRVPKDKIPLFLLAKQRPKLMKSALRRDPQSDPNDPKSWEEIYVNVNYNPFQTDQEKLNKLVELMYNFYANHDSKPFAEFLKELTVYEYQKISNFFYILREQQTVRCRILPMHYYKYQLEALCKKHHVRCPAELPAKAGMYYYSLYCGFKGFIVHPEGSKQKTSKLHASGSTETMYSFDKGHVFCFHKVNKSKRRKANPRKRTSIEMFSGVQEENFRKLSKDSRRQKAHNLCSNIPLTEISLIGFALECQEGLLTLCCNCANPAVFGINKFEDDKFVCTRCVCTCNDSKTPTLDSASVIICPKCNKRRNLYNEVNRMVS